MDTYDTRTTEQHLAALEAQADTVEATLDRINARICVLEKAVQGAIDVALHAARQVDGVSKRTQLHAEMFEELLERIANLEAELNATP